MPYVKVWLHFVWATKNRAPYLTDAIRPQIFQHIRLQIALKQACRHRFALKQAAEKFLLCLAKAAAELPVFLQLKQEAIYKSGLLSF